MWLDGDALPDFQPALKDAVQRIPRLIAGVIALDWGERALSDAYLAGESDHPYGFEYVHNTTDHLRVQNKRLLASLMNEEHKGLHEGLVEISSGGDFVLLNYGTKVPYAQTHEDGATVPAHFVATQGLMHRYFWARYYASGDERWMFAALKVLKHGGVNIKSYTIKARPFFWKGIDEFEHEHYDKAAQDLLDNIITILDK